MCVELCRLLDLGSVLLNSMLFFSRQKVGLGFLQYFFLSKLAQYMNKEGLLNTLTIFHQKTISIPSDVTNGAYVTDGCCAKRT